MTKKKKIVEVKMHQHTDAQGRIFGAPHPLDAKHEKEKTQRFHDRTVDGYRAWHRKK